MPSRSRWASRLCPSLAHPLRVPSRREDIERKFLSEAVRPQQETGQGHRVVVAAASAGVSVLRQVAGNKGSCGEFRTTCPEVRSIHRAYL